MKQVCFIKSITLLLSFFIKENLELQNVDNAVPVVGDSLRNTYGHFIFQAIMYHSNHMRTLSGLAARYR